MKKQFGFVNLIALCILVATLMFVPSFSAIKNTKYELIEQSFGLEESEYKGIISIYNLDCFEGGYISKTDYLNKVARVFESIHNGLYIHIVNMSLEEYQIKINNNEIPEIISFGVGLYNDIKNYLGVLDEYNYNLLPAFNKTAKMFAVPYLFGGYLLLSDKERLNKIGTSNIDEAIKTNSTNLYAYAKNNYINPENTVSLSNAVVSTDQYQSYIDYLSNKAVMLVGSQRDYIKLLNRQSLGKLSDLQVKFLTNYTDLVQYIGVTTSATDLKLKYANYFIQFLNSSTAIQLVKYSGMLSTSTELVYEQTELMQMEIAFKNIGTFKQCF